MIWFLAFLGGAIIGYGLALESPPNEMMFLGLALAAPGWWMTVKREVRKLFGWDKPTFPTTLEKE
jgi:hypothetical protein